MVQSNPQSLQPPFLLQGTRNWGCVPAESRAHPPATCITSVWAKTGQLPAEGRNMLDCFAVCPVNHRTPNISSYGTAEQLFNHFVPLCLQVKLSAAPNKKIQTHTTPFTFMCRIICSPLEQIILHINSSHVYCLFRPWHNHLQVARHDCAFFTCPGGLCIIIHSFHSWTDGSSPSDNKTLFYILCRPPIAQSYQVCTKQHISLVY